MAKRCPDCHGTGIGLTLTDGVDVCERCALRRHVERVIPAGSEGRLHPLREVILRAEPLTTRRWLTRAEDLLTGLHTGSIRLDHAVLDALPQRKAVEHMRALMISTGILSGDPARQLRWLESRLPELLADLNAQHHQVATRWIRWAVLARLRRLADQGGELALAVSNTCRKIEQVTTFLLILEAGQRALGSCNQHDIDDWFAGPGAIRSRLRPFLAWAQRHRQLPAGLILPKSYKGRPTAPTDSEYRWQIAEKLAIDGTLDPVDRVAGALVVLYAQPLTRIVALTTADVIVTHDCVRLRLGPDPLDFPEPFASLICTLPRKRRESTADQLPNSWLFSSSHAGRHLAPGVLGERLRRIGIQPQAMRLAAADQLCREVPPAMLAGVLGLHTATVARATAQTSGQWANYPSDRC